MAWAAGIWAGYVMGAILSSLAQRHWMLAGLALPLAGLAIIISADIRQPFDLEIG